MYLGSSWECSTLLCMDHIIMYFQSRFFALLELNIQMSGKLLN